MFWAAILSAYPSLGVKILIVDEFVFKKRLKSKFSSKKVTVYYN